MSEKLKDMIAYLCKNYPYSDELSKARLTKLVYLADWFSCLFNNKQMTEIKWVFNHHGPYVKDITILAEQNKDFDLRNTVNNYGKHKSVISYNGNHTFKSLSSKDKDLLDALIDTTKTMYFSEFIDYVYSTYPVKANERYSFLDLESLANDYLSINHKEQAEAI